MQDKPKKERPKSTGYGEYGLPKWLLHRLKSYSILESSRQRVLTRLYRMSRVIKRRQETLGILRHLDLQQRLGQNPGESHDFDFPD